MYGIDMGEERDTGEMRSAPVFSTNVAAKHPAKHFATYTAKHSNSDIFCKSQTYWKDRSQLVEDWLRTGLGAIYNVYI
jgi:hypothetical protein